MPKAMIIAIIVGSVSFLVPLMYGAVIDTDYDKWQAVSPVCVCVCVCV